MNKLIVIRTHNLNYLLIFVSILPPTHRPQLEYIGLIEESIINNGRHTISPANYRLRDNVNQLGMEFGFLMINLTNPESFNGLGLTP